MVMFVVAQQAPASSMAVPHGPDGVGLARRRLRADLRARGTSETTVDDAVLVLSELLSNACRHARPLATAAATADAEVLVRARADVSPAAGQDRDQATAADAAPAAEQPPAVAVPGTADTRVRADWHIDQDGRVTVAVTDGGGPTRPLPATPSVTAKGGRGLAIISSLACDWGVRYDPGPLGEVTVWASLPGR